MYSPSVKSRVAQTAIEYVTPFKELFIDREFLIYSEAFDSDQPYEHMTADPFNFAHLLGMHSRRYSNRALYDMAVAGTLSEDDFHFAHGFLREGEAKSFAKRKMRVFPYFETLLQPGVKVQKDFQKGSINGRFLLFTDHVAMCFSSDDARHPNSLLEPRGALNLDRARPVELIISRPKGSETYDRIEFGEPSVLRKYAEYLPAALSNEIRTQAMPTSRSTNNHSKKSIA